MPVADATELTLHFVSLSGDTAASIEWSFGSRSALVSFSDVIAITANNTKADV
jgi:hypothetical protein